MTLLYAGLDCGGTKTAAAIVDSSGTVVGRGYGGSGNIAANDRAIVLDSIRSALAAAESSAGLNGSSPVRYQAVCAAVAGYTVEENRERFRIDFKDTVSANKYRVEPDYSAAYQGATHGNPGIVVIAGTGAVAFGVNAEGHSYKADGLGYLLGDKGSGFDLGLYALRYALQQMERNGIDPLTQVVLEYTGTERQSQLLQWLYGNFSPARVASLAPVVGTLAEDGDAAARSLISEMARRLRHTVREVRHRLWMPKDVPVYPLGGLWQLGTFFRQEFAEPQWQRDAENEHHHEALSAGNLNLCEPLSPADQGAAMLAVGF